MSFSSQVKEELAAHLPSARHCQLAELAALLLCGAQMSAEEGLVLAGDNRLLLRKCFTLLKKTFNIDTGLGVESLETAQEEPGSLWKLPQAERILLGVKWPENADRMQLLPQLLIKNTCCRRAALRGLFIGMGSMSDPKSAYHLEFVCQDEALAKQICQLLASFELEGKVVLRKKYYVVYMKEGAAIVDLLNIMEAHVSLMELENLRILKDISGSVNRRVNCETANIMKTVNAAGRQVADIMLIEETRGISSLPDSLQEAARLRITYPDMTLSELAGAMNPPLGKSGMNHRLRKLSEIAGEIRSSHGV